MKICIILLFTLFIQVISSAVMAEEIIRITPMNFGEVVLHPVGDSITIDARNGGTVKPRAMRSLVTGGQNGLVNIRVLTEETVLISVGYPTSTLLTGDIGGQELRIVDIDLYSEDMNFPVTLPSDGKTTVSISLGGTLLIPNNTIHGYYTGTMSIYITFE